MERSDLGVLDAAAAHARAYLNGVADRPVAAGASSSDLRASLGRPLPVTGDAPEDIIGDLARAAGTGTVATAGPRFFGFVIGGSLPVAVAADWLVSSWDQNAGVYVLSPLVAVVEDIAAGWITSAAHLPQTMSVGFVTGCQMANFTALAAARHHVLAAHGWDVEARGLQGAPPVTVITSAESHYTIFMALRLLGFGADTAIRVATDDQGRMRADELARVLAGVSGPAIVCAQAGNVNTGAFDPIEDIATIIADPRTPNAGRRTPWLHVDGAFGLWARASRAHAALARGMERADSIACDAHKWLNVPYDSGLVFCAHEHAHRAAMSLAASYIQASTADRDPHEFVPEESRRARAVPIYAALRALGASGLDALVDRNCAQARRMAQRLSVSPRVAILNDVVLNQVLVRFDDADDVTRAVIAGVQQDGTCWLGGTVWHGVAAMRVAVSNWSTTDADIDRSADAILRVLAAIS